MTDRRRGVERRDLRHEKLTDESDAERSAQLGAEVGCDAAKPTCLNLATNDRARAG